MNQGVVVRYTDQRDFVISLARDAVSAVAPEELPFFAATSEAYFRDPERALAGDRGGDEVLGSGIDTVVALVSPVALAVAAAVYQQLTDKVGAAVVRGGGKLVRRVFRRRGRPLEPAAQLPATLGEEERERVAHVVRERAQALGLTGSKVDALVDSVLASLTNDEHRLPSAAPTRRWMVAVVTGQDRYQIFARHQTRTGTARAVLDQVDLDAPGKSKRHLRLITTEAACDEEDDPHGCSPWSCRSAVAWRSTMFGVIQYRLPTTGGIVPLLEIVPSKTDEERLLVVAPELADVVDCHPPDPRT